MCGCVDADDEARGAYVVLDLTPGGVNGERSSNQGLEMGKERLGSWQTSRLARMASVEKGGVGDVDRTKRRTDGVILG